MRNFKSARQSTKSDAFLSSDRDDRIRDLLSPLNLPALSTGGSKVRLIAIGNPASVTEMINRLHIHLTQSVPIRLTRMPRPYGRDQWGRLFSISNR